MLRRATATRIGAVATLGFVLGLGASCGLLTGEDFNAQAMDLAAEIDGRCDLRVGDNESTDTPYLVYKSEDLDACETSCRFREQAARKCLRRLERMADTCDVLSLAVCRRVYVDCGPSFDHNRCDLGQCSVSSRPRPEGGLLALGLLALGLMRRRRATGRRSSST